MYGVCGNDHVVIVTRNFTKRTLRSLAPSVTDRFILVFHPPPSHRPSFAEVSTHPSVLRGRWAPDPPLAIMHYETRNDESAYVSHVMEIPLLIRALNDSATAGYITCIITLATACWYTGNVSSPSSSSSASFFSLGLFLFCSPAPRRVRYYRQAKSVGDLIVTPRLSPPPPFRGRYRRDGNDLCSGL